ncbi:MAG: glucose-1-phosphate adenylyltransferase subunit GlgD [Clostridia bacterium]|nr:glucose-1-phosphate adenylyltransferase subunit GlgD [Clostridia bacterium]
MKAMGVIFSNIYDSALAQLTSMRTVASLPFGGRYRFIDFVLSNLSNSGIYNIGIITKYNYRSLMDHLGNLSDWDLNRKNESVLFLPPFVTGNTGVYKGKLEALHSAMNFIETSDHDYVIVCDSTVLCNVDFRAALRQHARSGCDVTILANREPFDPPKKHPLILKADKNNLVTDILIDTFVQPDSYVGLGMFIFNRKHLLEVLEETYAKGLVHLERDFLQRKLNENALTISVYPVKGVVLRNEDIRSYYANNMALMDKAVRDDLFNPDRPIYTKVRDEAPTYYGEGNSVKNSLIADGCKVNGTVENSVIFRGVSVEKDAAVVSSIVMQGARIGKGAHLECVILDKNVTVNDGTVLKGTPEHPVIIQKGETA